MSKKLYFLTTEIIPFADVTSLADFFNKNTLSIAKRVMISELYCQSMDM